MLPQSITIGIPTFNRHQYLFKTIEQLLKENHPAVLEVIIVDQTPRDKICRNIQKNIQKLNSLQNLKYIFRKEANLPAARNYIINNALGELLIFVDDDVLLSKNFIQNHLISYSDSKIKGIAGQVFEFKNSELFNYSEPVKTLKKYCFPIFKEKHINNPKKRFLPGGNFSVLKKSCLTIRGFDESFINPALGEDNDFSERLKNHFGKNCINFSKKAFIIHLKAPSGGVRIFSPLSTTLTLSNHIYIWRHSKGISFVADFLLSTFRAPLKKENLIKIHKQPLLWYYFFRSFFLAYKKSKSIKSSILEH